MKTSDTSNSSQEVSSRSRVTWQSLEELVSNQAGASAEAQAFKTEFLRRYPLHFLNRREFMGWMGALSAVLGATGCTRQPNEKILPYSKNPEGLVPGKPLFFASAYHTGHDVLGILVESHMGRPTKIEGNPDHPANLGATDRYTQAAVLELYDPDRCQGLTYKGVPASWRSLQENIAAARQEWDQTGGEGLRILSETVPSPSLAASITALLKRYPKAKWYRHDGVDRRNYRAGLRTAFGRPADCHYRVAEADVIVSLDSDFLDSGPGHVRYHREFSSRRRGEEGQEKFNRLYAFESTTTVTGSGADHRWPVQPDEIHRIAYEIARQLGVPGATVAEPGKRWEAIVAAVVRDLRRVGNRALVVAGEYQPVEVHVLAHAINAQLGAIGRTVVLTDPIDPSEGLVSDAVEELVDEMKNNEVNFLLSLGGNPVYTLPAELGFASAVAGVKHSVHLTLYADETGAAFGWQVPKAHSLESWGDFVAFDGTASIVQPLIEPLYQGKTPLEMVALLGGESEPKSYDLVRNAWKATLGGDFEKSWRRAVHDGVVANTAAKPLALGLARGLAHPAPATEAAKGLTVVLRPDPSVWDGRYANNGWLLELPKPLSKITWDNAFEVAPKTAQANKWANGDVIEVAHGGRRVSGPVWIVPGMPEGVMTAHLGYGRRAVGRLGNGVGFDAYSLRQRLGQWSLPGVTVKVTGGHHKIACTQDHWRMEGRDPVRRTTVEEHRKHPEAIHATAHHGPAKETHATGPVADDPVFADPNYAWGMVIDLSACIGCNACVLGCQSENNIPIVGREEVAKGREMHWLRIDRYYEGGAENPEVHNQPMTCMHCEKAPCEVVCPVNATSHSPEGINEMTYNRCVGTKYCANNCPYKVRRFNFFQYSDFKTPQIQLGRNPDVTVRARGVMEKCTYCVQRVNEARINAKNEGRLIRDGEVITACQSVCPSQAIVFGNVKDKNSRVSKLREKNTHYGVLAELGTQPRTTYLAKLTNPNPEIVKLVQQGEAR